MNITQQIVNGLVLGSGYACIAPGDRKSVV